MIYFTKIKMGIYKTIHITLAALLLFLSTGIQPVFCQNHIRDLDAVRTSMTEFGNKMPAMIKSAENRDIRTLERVFEINTYALTTIEAYFKMIKVAVSSEGDINKEIMEVLNGWLEFISNYCKKDMEYFDEALSDTSDEAIIDVVLEAKKNIKSLSDATIKAIDENKSLAKKL